MNSGLLTIALLLSHNTASNNWIAHKLEDVRIFLDTEYVCQYVKALIDDPLFSSFFFCILSVILSAIFSIFWYFITLRKIKPFWSIDIDTCLDTSFAFPGSLSLLYAGKKLEKLAVYRFCFWNSGTEAIRDSDVMQQLEISIPEQYSIFHAEQPEKGFETDNIVIQDDEDRKSVIIKFKYLEPKQGFEFFLITDCINPNEISLKGKILGCKELQNQKTMNPYRRKGKRLLHCLIGVLVSYALYDISMCIRNSAFYSNIQSDFVILGKIIDTALIWVNVLSLTGFSIALSVIIMSYLKNRNKPQFL